MPEISVSLSEDLMGIWSGHVDVKMVGVNMSSPGVWPILNETLITQPGAFISFSIKRPEWQSYGYTMPAFLGMFVFGVISPNRWREG